MANNFEHISNVILPINSYVVAPDTKLLATSIRIVRNNELKLTRFELFNQKDVICSFAVGELVIKMVQAEIDMAQFFEKNDLVFTVEFGIKFDKDKFRDYIKVLLI